MIIYRVSLDKSGLESLNFLGSKWPEPESPMKLKARNFKARSSSTIYARARAIQMRLNTQW